MGLSEMSRRWMTYPIPLLPAYAPFETELLG